MSGSLIFRHIIYPVLIVNLSCPVAHAMRFVMSQVPNQMHLFSYVMSNSWSVEVPIESFKYLQLELKIYRVYSNIILLLSQIFMYEVPIDDADKCH